MNSFWIKHIELINFQKHSHFKAEFSPKVNIIYGASDSGKSCIIRSIRWLFFPNELKGDIVRKEGTKKTSVKVILDNGVIIERIKSATVNTYKVTIGKEIRKYDAIGKGLPEEFYSILKVKPIEIDRDSLILNVANQLSLPFLFDKSATFRVKLFNKLTGNDIIDNVFQSLNKDILQIGREEKLENEHLLELEKSQEQIKIDKNKLEKFYKKFSIEYEALKKKINIFNSLKECQDNLNKVDNELKDVNLKLKQIKTIPDKTLKQIEIKITKFDNLMLLMNHLREIKEEIIEVDEGLASLVLPKININKLRNDIQKLEDLAELKSNLKENKENLDETLSELNTIVSELGEGIDTYKTLLEKIGICPICKTKINTEILKEIKL